MTTEFLLSSHLKIEEASEHLPLIEAIMRKELAPPKVKVLKNTTYKGAKVLRAKLNKGSRLIFNWEKDENNKEILQLITINTKHKYEEVKRELSGVNPKASTLVKIEEKPPVVEEIKPAVKSDWAILTINKIIIPDEDQKKVLQKLQKPAVFTGPPGAGKTTVLYNSLMLTLKHEKEVKELNPQDEVTSENIFFFSHSPNLLKNLEDDSKTHPGLPAIIFTSWEKLLIQKNPGKQLIDEHAFAKWLSSQKCTLTDKLPEIIQYEFSLIVALGFEKYKDLGERQCYYAKASAAKKKELNKLLQAWLAHLNDLNLLDPMVSTIPTDEKIDRANLDEGQNLPPVALKYLIQHTPKEGFAISLDSEQCLTISPYIENCLVTLLHTHYGMYFPGHLPRSYRCSAPVAELGCQVMRLKHRLDGKHARRSYQEIKSALDIEGVVSWITKDFFNQLDDHCKDPETAVLVPDNISEKEIDQIKKNLKTDYILRYSQAIGLDLNNVILWKPFSLVSALKNLNKHGDNAIPDGLTLPQWKAFNALYMAITRAKTGVYIYEEDPFYKNLGEYILGNLPKKNKILSTKKLTQEELTKKLQQAIETHLNQKQIEIARNLMVKLGMSANEITEKIKAHQALNHPPVQAPEPVVTQSIKAVEQTSRTPIKRQYRNKSLTKISPETIEPLPESLVPLPKNYQMQKTDNYILSLLKNKNPDSLKLLFEHKNFINILFRTSIIDKDEGMHFKSLFSKLVSDEIWINQLLRLTFNKLQNSLELRQQLSGNFLFEISSETPPLFLFLIEHEDGIKILINLLEKNPKLINKINAEVLYSNYEVEGLIFFPAFNILCESTLGISLLSKLLQLNIKLEKVPGNLLCEVLDNKEAGASYSKSPLLWLLSHNSDLARAIIHKITLANPGWVKNLTPQVLCNLCPPEAGELVNTSVLYWLLMNDLHVFKLLIETNPKLLEDITAEAFYTNMKNFSAFLGLIIGGKEGLEILDKILLLNPNLIDKATLKDLCFKAFIRNEAKTCYQITPLFWLTYEHEFVHILEKILLKNQALSTELTADHLCEAFGVNLNQGYGKSILFELSRTDNGQKILVNLFKVNPNLLPSLTWEALTMPMDEETQISVLLNFCLYPIGLEILSDLVDQNQNLTKNFTTQALTRKYQTLSGFQCNLYSALKSSVLGKEILKKLEPICAQSIILAESVKPTEQDTKAPQISLMLEKTKKKTTALSYIPNLLQNKNPRSLVNLFEHKNLIKILFQTPVFDEDQRIFYDSLFLRLLNDPIWTQVLLILTMKKIQAMPEFHNQFSGEFLCKKSINENLSAFILLIEDQIGIQILMSLLKKHPEIALRINATVLYSTHQARGGKFFLSPLDMLFETLLGVNLFAQLLALNPKLAEQVPGKLLCRNILHAEAGKYFYKSPLLNLILHNCELSKIVIRKITQASRNWVKELTPEILCNLMPLTAGNLANTSMLYWLIRYDKDIFILLNEISQNQLIKRITAKAFYTNMRNFSVFIGLITSKSEDLKFLKNIMAQNPELIHDITLDDLCFRLHLISTTSAPFCITPFFSLSHHEECLKLLTEILYKNQRLTKEITADVLCQPYGLDIKAGYGSSILLELSSTKKGLALLSYLFKENQNLLPFLTYEALTLKMDKKANVIPLLNLCLTLDGLKIFTELLEKNPNFTKKLNREMLTRQYKTISGMRHSIFSALNCSKLGQEIAKLLDSVLPPQINLAEKAGQFGIFHSSDTSSEEMEKSFLNFEEFHPS